jgi:hypothetical protein
MKPFTVVIIASLSILLPMAARALDESDVGYYHVLDQGGKPTSKTFRLLREGSLWKVEDKQSDGTWQDVNCQGGCDFQASEESDFKRFFPADDLSKVTMSCVHSVAFALCRYSRKAVPGERGYVFIALTEKYPIPLRLARVKGDA